MRDPGLTRAQRFAKRTLDLAIALPGLLLSSPVILLAVLTATVDTRQWGVFRQERVGRHGMTFRVYKIRTMRANPTVTTNVTSTTDARITRSGRLFRRLKIDELPQLFNVVRGDMSLIGPRPDVVGFADLLEGDDRIILTVRPGITGPATVVYRDEESMLAAVGDPETYNATVIWPHKVQLNRTYVENYRLADDLRLMAQTLFHWPHGHRP